MKSILLLSVALFLGQEFCHTAHALPSASSTVPEGTIIDSPPPGETVVDGLLSDCEKHSKTSCFECVSTPQLTDFGVVVDSTPCRWCPTTQECHAYGSLFDGACDIPIHTNDVKDQDYSNYVCESSHFAHIASDFSNVDTDSLKEWVLYYLNNFSGEKHKFLDWGDETGIFSLATGKLLTHEEAEKLKSRNGETSSDTESVTIAVASDWGSGTRESAAVASNMAQVNADFTIHLGDVYYEALPEEIETNMYGKAPNEHQIGNVFPLGEKNSFYLNANHEMLSLGNGYFDTLLPKTDQKASFFSLESDYWRFVGLDTGYDSYKTFEHIDAISELVETDAPLQDKLVKWLNETLKIGEMCGSDKRGVVLFSHHQPISDFMEDEAYLGASKQLNDIMPHECTFIWLVGHEHSFNVYNKTDAFDGVEISFYNRLVGNGGFPQPPQEPSKHTFLHAYDNRVYKTFQLNGGKTEDYVFNGFFTMKVDGPRLYMEYHTVKCEGGGETTCPVIEGPHFNETTILMSETFEVDNSGSVNLVSQDLNRELLTVIDPSNIKSYILPPEKRKKRQKRAFEDLFPTDDNIGKGEDDI